VIFLSSLSIVLNFALLLDGYGDHVASKNIHLALALGLNTWDLLQRKKFFLKDYSCVLCNGNLLETRDHLFFHFSVITILQKKNAVQIQQYRPIFLLNVSFKILLK
jgi:hypothetical protein